jgi:hypothetical protein
MRIVAGLAAAVGPALLLGARPAPAQPALRAVSAQPAPHIDYIEVISSGYSGAGEAVRQGPVRRYVTHTPVRAANVGTKFDIKFRTAGQPDGTAVTLRMVWRAPRPGVKDAKSGKFSRTVEEEIPTKIGTELARSFEFKIDAQILRGTWHAEVWNGARRLAMRRIAVQ